MKKRSHCSGKRSIVILLVATSLMLAKSSAFTTTISTRIITKSPTVSSSSSFKNSKVINLNRSNASNFLFELTRDPNLLRNSNRCGSSGNYNYNHHGRCLSLGAVVKDEEHEEKIVPDETNCSKSTTSVPTVSWKSIRSAWSQSQKSAMTFLAAALIMASVLLTPFQEALAAPSGGRMGGSFGGGSNRQSYSSGRSSYRPQSSYNSYSRGFTQGYGTGYLSRPSVTVVPSIGGYGYGYGYLGAPIVTSPGLTVVSRGPSIVDFLIFGFFATVLFRTFTSSFVDGDGYGDGGVSMVSSSALGSGVTVAQISVAVRVPNRNDPTNILNFLERLSRTASTDSRVGISNLVSQVALELLRQKRSIFAADTEYKHFQSNDENGAQRHFSSKAIQERSKFEKESTNRYGGVDYSSQSLARGGGDGSGGLVVESNLPSGATNAVVTLILSIDGDSTKLPQINNMSDLEKALTRIATDVKVDDCLRSAEVLWTPDDRNDVLSDRDIYVDYPKLRNV